jgi:glycosyltransferase involved in cell wall biosynthesis
VISSQTREAREAATLADAIDERVVAIIPAFNERDAISDTIRQVRAALNTLPHRSEIVVVDDGSTDGTGDLAEASGVRVIRVPSNRGYGTALKTGVLATDSEYVVIIDADGTYPPDAIPRLVMRAADADMVVGARSALDVSIPAVRRPAKWFLARLSGYLAGQRIPDLNSGLRVMRRKTLNEFLHLMPSGFSFTSTITLSMLCTMRQVIYEPVVCKRRVGTSKIRAMDFTNFVMLVLRTVVLFNPLKIFLPLGAILFLLGTIKFVYDVYLWNLSESAVMAFLAAIIVWSVGLLADMIARLQLRPPSHS